MTDLPRLIEHAFPLKHASLDSVHEKIVRQEIRKAYGGRAPKVLDPSAGGGAIPLEAMRLGCEATAVDINPVAWFHPQVHTGVPAQACRPHAYGALNVDEWLKGQR